MVNIRTVLLALPTLYLVIALLFLNGGRSPRLPQVNVVPDRVLFLVQGKSDGGSAPSAPNVAPPAAAPVEAPKSEGPAPPPPKVTTTEQVTFYDGNSVNVYPFATEGTGTESWWKNVKRGWEEDSLYALKAMLMHRPGATYIDFGSWIGPTVLFSTPYAAKVYALEPDLAAFQQVYWNVKANPHIAPKVSVQNLCISNQSGVLKMQGVPGDSMSTLFTVQTSTDRKDKPAGWSEWEVRCTTLDQFVKDNNIDASKLVLKIDTEGAERDIIIQLAPFIARYKPSMLLSFHAFQYPDDHESHRKIKEIMMTYKTAMLPRGETFQWSAFSVGGWCRLCAMMLSDDPITSAEVTPVKHK